MKKNILAFIIILLGSIILLNACKKNKSTSEFNFNVSAKDATEEYTIEIKSKKNLYVGYNILYVGIKNNTTNQYEQTADITIRPYMPAMPSMGIMMPCNNPISKQAENNFFTCGADFTMASNADDVNVGLWNLEVKAKLPNKVDSVKTILTFSVADTRQATNDISTNKNETFANTLSLNGQSYRIDIVAPRQFIVGTQSLEIRIFKKIGSGATGYWESVVDNNLKITNLKTWMPDMEHDSPNNVDPILNTNIGVYQGTINFTMTGLWDIKYQLSDGTNIVDGKFTVIL